jgi:hypothetical protein
VNALIAAENRSSVEKSSLNKHIETLNETVVKYQRKIDVLDADNRRLMQVGDQTILPIYIYGLFIIYGLFTLLLYY